MCGKFGLICRFNQWGIWSSGKGLEAFPYNKWKSRSDLSDVFLKAVTLAEKPYLTVAQVQEDDIPPGYVWRAGHQLVNAEGFLGNIWASLQQRTNFSYNMVNILENCIYIVDFYQGCSN